MAGQENATQNMTREEFENAAKLYREVQVQEKNIKKELEKISDILKAEMDARGVEKAQAGVFEVYYQEIITPRFDSSAFKISEPELYAKYVVESKGKRFRVM